MGVSKSLKIFFNLICFSLVAISVVHLFRRWLDNTDASSIYFKKYNKNEKDKYPTYSLCFHSTGGGALFDSFAKKLLMNYAMNPAVLEMLLTGEEFIYRPQKTNFQNISDINYEQYMIKLEDIVLTLQFYVANDKLLFSYDNSEEHENLTGNDNEWPFYVSHVEPKTICFTRKSMYVKDLILKSDLISMSLEKMKGWNQYLYFKVFVHHPGQLTRVLDTPIFSSLVDDINDHCNHMIFYISQVTVLRKRFDSNTPCDQYLQDDESKLRQEIVTRAGCIPIYWESFKDLYNFTGRCQNSTQLRSIYYDIENFKTALDSYQPPCNEMRSVTTMQKQPYYTNESIVLDIFYMEETYQEIVNYRDFTMQGFFSDCGGFIGMILGYSLLQIPNEIIRIWKTLRIRRNLKSDVVKSVLVP